MASAGLLLLQSLFRQPPRQEFSLYELREATGVPSTSTRRDKSSLTPQSLRFALNQRMSQFALVGVRPSRHSSVTIKPHSEPICAPLLRGERPSLPRTVLNIRQDQRPWLSLPFPSSGLLPSKPLPPSHNARMGASQEPGPGKEPGVMQELGTGKEPGNRRAARVGVASKWR